MALTESEMLELGTQAPDFSLPDTDGRTVSRSDFSDAEALAVLFICNHCPYVKHIREELARFARDYAGSDLGIVAISSNDIDQYPSDSPVAMKEEAKTYGYTFPYLFDEDQSVAKSYTAMCTPDFFLFGPDRKLVYRGRFDESRPDSGVPVTGKDLRAAVDAVLGGDEVDEPHRPSMGCSIKWKPGNAPAYFSG
ncbi:MAG: thioredoxin family protein [Actinobacteria bacterium]|nr:thioredoxin family protein [Actinomycetota bacterium]